MDFLGHPPQVLCDYCSVSLGDFRYERESVGREESLAGFTPSLQCFRLSLTSGEVPALQAPHRKCWGRDGRRSVWRRRCAGLPPSGEGRTPPAPRDTSGKAGAILGYCIACGALFLVARGWRPGMLPTILRGSRHTHPQQNCPGSKRPQCRGREAHALVNVKI